MRTPELLDAARKRAGIPSDYALAARLGVTRATVSVWRNGRGVPDTTHASTLADLAGLDWPQVFASLELQRAELSHLDLNAAAWRSILQRIGGAAAMVFLSTCIVSAPSPAAARQISASADDEPLSVYYVKSQRRGPGG